MRRTGYVQYLSKVFEPPGAVLKLFMGTVGSSRSRAPRECLLLLFWLIVAKLAVLWRLMCAGSCAYGGGSRA